MSGLDFVGQLEQSFDREPVGIVEFAESPKYCGKTLYPRQKLLLKLFFLEELTEREEKILDYWIAGGASGDEIDISPDIRERIQWCKDHGFKHFREIVLVGGRRCSKGFLTGISMSKLVYDLIQMQNPNRHYGIDEDKEIVFSVVAAAQDQAKDMQYADFQATVNSCNALQRNIFKTQELEFSLMTEADLRQMANWKRRGRRIQRDTSTIRGKAMAANSRTIRGSATMGIVFDEFAFFMQGENDQSDTAIYDAAIPALSQFVNDGMIFCNPPEAPMLMDDLSFKPIGEMKVGDRVVGWQRRESGKQYFQSSEVVDVIRRRSPIVKVKTASGREFRCTPDHRWLTTSYGGKKTTHNGEWYAPPQVGRKLCHIVDPVQEIDLQQARDAAWLAGMFDGEGHASPGQAITIAQSQEHNPELCAELERVLNRLGFMWERTDRAYRLIGGGFAGSRQLYVDFVNKISPMRKQGIVNKFMQAKRQTEDVIVSVEPDGEGEVIALTTTTGNYVCNGFASKNCNSSPYSKVGKFYQRFEEGMVGKDDKEKEWNPSMVALRFPSWALFEGWWEDPDYTGPRKTITASPDWDLDKIDPETGELFYTDEDRSLIRQARTEEASEPISYKVERRGHFAEVIDAYLEPEKVDRMFRGRPVWEPKEDPPLAYYPYNVNWSDSTYRFRYVGHIDPSSTTAGFGFAMGHTEFFQIGDEINEHVVFDIIQRWDPGKFNGGAIEWEPILEQLLTYCDIFRPERLTFDQHQNRWPMEWLNKEIKARGIGETRVFEKTADMQRNWNRAEVFRTALYHNRVHAPNDTADCEWGAKELKYLQEIKTARIPRVEKQDQGPVTTKDVADCLMEVVEVLIGSEFDRSEALAMPPAFGSPGGYRMGGSPFRNEIPEALSGYYTRRTGEQGMTGGRAGLGGGSPARRAFGGRPVPRPLPRRGLPGR